MQLLYIVVYEIVIKAMLYYKIVNQFLLVSKSNEKYA